MTFSAREHVPLITRCLHYLRRNLLKVLGFSTGGVTSRYVPLTGTHRLKVGYLLMDYVDRGKMLTTTWKEQRSDLHLRTNLFKDLSRIILSLGRLPQPRIGSFTINDDGVLTLTNRPLTLELHQMENLRIPINIPRSLTYTLTDSYVIDLLHCHRTRFIHQPNSVRSRGDGLYQTSAIAAMGAVPVFSHFFDRSLRNGPFALTLTDLHHSNIFVNDEWHITSLVDLEWACVRPIEMHHPPSWLTDEKVDTIDVDAYDPIRQEFMDIFEGEEAKEAGTERTDIMRKGWESGRFWYCLALDSQMGLTDLLYQHIQPIFRTFKTLEEKAMFYSIMSQYWMPGLGTFLDSKVEENTQYESQLRAVFESPEMADCDQ
ncbi:MAG: hypothetical protein M1837_005836 [Sclerophora amabilis]|nr:MAG: hypothetical protein M1837_005836 [Sclerophora amabilis]